MSDEKKDTPEQAEFRAHCQKWLAENHPGKPPVPIPQGALELSDPAALEWLQRWQKSVYDAGLVGCDYARESGGGGMTDCQAIANHEMQRAKTPFLPNIIGSVPSHSVLATTFFFFLSLDAVYLKSAWADSISLTSSKAFGPWEMEPSASILRSCSGVKSKMRARLRYSICTLMRPSTGPLGEP